MKKLKALSKRGLALFVALLMCATMLPMSAFASEDNSTEEPSTECNCTTKCTEDEPNAECPVCSAENADRAEVCTGTEQTTEPEEPEEQPKKPICDFESESGTLTITGVKDLLTGDMVRKYLADNTAVQADLKHLVLKDIGSIANYAFHLWGNLESVTIDGADTVGDHSFFKCATLENVDLKNVSKVDGNAFSENDLLTDVSLDNIDFVGAEAFRHCDTLANLSMQNIREFDRSPFSYCIGLTSVNLDGEQEKIGTLGKTMFYQCTSLESVTLKNFSAIPVQMFNGCTGLKTVTLEDIESIDTQVFYDCTGLETVTMNKIETIGSNMLQNCTGSITLNLTDVATIGQTAFLSCAGLRTVTMTNIDAIGKSAFYNCTNLTSVEMDNVTIKQEDLYNADKKNYSPPFINSGAEGMTLTVKNSALGGYAFYGCTGLTTANIDNVDTIGQYAFQNCKKLTDVKMTEIDTIDQYAFWGCSELRNIDSLSNVKSRIGGFAFYGCSSLKELTVEDMTKMGYNGSVEMMERMQAILAGKFQLDNAETIRELTLEGGWTAGAVAKSEGWTNTNYDNATQLMQQARWQNGTATAEVKVDAYYTANKQMDYIFVADLSASMAQLGNPEDSNARFYDMQSKLLDMTGKLLDTNGYDCQVAIVTFGGLFNGTETCNTMAFTKDAQEVETHIKSLEPLNENTDYGMGLDATLEVVKAQESGRNTVVVFLSDGYPTVDNHKDGWGTLSAKAIKDAGVPIYGVLHSPTSGSRDKALEIMTAVCSQITDKDGNPVKTVFESTDTDSFGAAMNKAFSAAYTTNTVTIPVNAEQFDVVVPANKGATYDADEGVITWTVGMPFTQNTLTYTMTLKDELANRIGTYNYNINNGNAKFGDSGASVGINLTLRRSVSNPTPPTPVNPDPPVTTYTVRYTDGVEDEVIFADQVDSGLSYGAATPAFRGEEPVREGYTFGGWEPEVSTTVTRSATYTAIWEEEIVDPSTPLVVAPGLDTENHLAYINGYGGRLVKPQNNITRAEVATIFYRLMEDSFRGTYWTNSNTFTDVNNGDWFNNAVSTSADAELIKGYGDGTFKGNRAITRAEFATIAARFIPDIEGNVEDYPDTANHWAAKEIRVVTEAGWFTGDNRGFRPNDPITRAEAMTVVNRMVNRVPHGEENLLEGMVTWDDNNPGAWYYEAVQEATNSHNYEHGQRGDESDETWTELIPNPDWKALEKEWEAEYLGA